MPIWRKLICWCCCSFALSPVAPWLHKNETAPKYWNETCPDRVSPFFGSFSHSQLCYLFPCSNLKTWETLIAICSCWLHHEGLGARWWVPCAHSEPGGPGNSWVFVGVLTVSAVILGGRCVLSMNERQQDQQQVGVFGWVQRAKSGRIKQEVGLKKNCRRMSWTNISTGLSKTELLFELQPTCTSGMQCLLLPWKSKKVSESVFFVRRGRLVASGNKPGQSASR